MLPCPLPLISNRYHLLDANQQCRGQLKIGVRTFCAHQSSVIETEYSSAVESVDARLGADLPTLASLANGRPNTLTDVAKQHPIEPSQEVVSALMDQMDATHRAEQELQQANATQRALQQSAILSEFHAALKTLEGDAVEDMQTRQHFPVLARQLVNRACDALRNLDGLANIDELVEEMRRLVLVTQTRVSARFHTTNPDFAALHATLILD